MTHNSAVDDQSHARIELTRFDIDRILHFAHPIPWKHGWHQRHLNDHHGEWDWNDMIAMLRHAEVLIDRPGGRRCHWKLKKLTATSPTDVHVEWDPNVTVDDGRFYHQGKDTDFSVPALSTIVAEALGIADDSGSTDSALFKTVSISRSFCPDLVDGAEVIY